MPPFFMVVFFLLFVHLPIPLQRSIVVMPFIRHTCSKLFFTRKSVLFTLLRVNWTKIISIYKIGLMYRCSWHRAPFVQCVT